MFLGNASLAARLTTFVSSAAALACPRNTAPSALCAHAVTLAAAIAAAAAAAQAGQAGYTADDNYKAAAAAADVDQFASIDYTSAMNPNDYATSDTTSPDNFASDAGNGGRCVCMC
jgi:hypothetical protein